MFADHSEQTQTKILPCISLVDKRLHSIKRTSYQDPHGTTRIRNPGSCLVSKKVFTVAKGAADRFSLSSPSIYYFGIQQLDYNRPISAGLL